MFSHPTTMMCMLKLSMLLSIDEGLATLFAGLQFSFYFICFILILLFLFFVSVCFHSESI